jgi:DNA-directed RNA polymerase subunit RPC12/RpoP
VFSGNTRSAGNNSTTAAKRFVDPMDSIAKRSQRSPYSIQFRHFLFNLTHKRTPSVYYLRSFASLISSLTAPVFSSSAVKFHLKFSDTQNMPEPKCPKCGHTEFCLKKVSVDPAPERAHFIICAKCGTIVGTHETDVISHLIYMQKKLGIF